MAFGIIHRFAGGTREQYENTIKAVHPDGGTSLPKGQTLHVAGSTPDGWVIVAVHDTADSWEQFRDNILGPRLPSVENGLGGPTDETTFEVHTVQTA